jgi:hypothetical protein
VEIAVENTGHLEHFAGLRVRLRRSARDKERVRESCASTTSKRVAGGKRIERGIGRCVEVRRELRRKSQCM